LNFFRALRPGWTIPVPARLLAQLPEIGKRNPEQLAGLREIGYFSTPVTVCRTHEGFDGRFLSPVHAIAEERLIMSVRGIRGATSVEADVPEQILAATRELLQELLRVNGITEFDEIVSAIFTTSPDLTSTFPAEAARSLGMKQVPLLCASEIAVPTASVPRCIRVLLHVNTDKKQAEIVHVYLRDAKRLRPDMISAQ
jgi:chorismate mutase